MENLELKLQSTKEKQQYHSLFSNDNFKVGRLKVIKGEQLKNVGGQYYNIKLYSNEGKTQGLWKLINGEDNLIKIVSRMENGLIYVIDFGTIQKRGKKLENAIFFKGVYGISLSKQLVEGIKMKWSDVKYIGAQKWGKSWYMEYIMDQGFKINVCLLIRSILYFLKVIQ
ncbi:unnamed protein product [Paramecium pentaurelia]|uniref:Uncharacterized protein n=1 Tax=Paramecium pentaurelia TaxID=43138 RepID=A0A8S1XUB9_9CILI|nr:unnamed protein product [Paramecium pentaurelia]